MDNSAELTAGAAPEQARRGGRGGGGFSSRGYPDWQALIAGEASLLPLESRVDYLTIVTPNDAHVAPAEAAAAAEFAILCEKPLATSLDEARRLQAVVLAQDVPFIVAHTYTGYPMVMLARRWSARAISARSARSRRGIPRAGWRPAVRMKGTSRPPGESTP